MEPVDHLGLRLTGLARASHDSITVHWVTDNRDIRAIAYDDALIALAGLERSKLPDLVPTGSVLGGLAPAAAGELGLLAGTAVVAGCGDLHSAAVGSGAVEDFDAHVRGYRDVELVSRHVPFAEDRRAGRTSPIPSGIPGRYLVADEHDRGVCLTWLRDNVLYPGDALADGDGRVPQGFFATLNDVASSVPVGAHGVLFTPWLNGERSPVDDHTIRGGFHNLSLSSTRADMVRSRVDGVALQLGLVARGGREVLQAALSSTHSPSWAGRQSSTCGPRSTRTRWAGGFVRSRTRCWPTCAGRPVNASPSTGSPWRTCRARWRSRRPTT